MEEEDKTERRSRMAVAHYTGADLKIRHLPPATHPIGSCDGWTLRKPLGGRTLELSPRWRCGGHSGGGAKGDVMG